CRMVGAVAVFWFVGVGFLYVGVVCGWRTVLFFLLLVLLFFFFKTNIFLLGFPAKTLLTA
ncbi:hypothetical protein ACNIU7_28530, partial [Escherichia coli]